MTANETASAEFFGWVDESLGPQMAGLGYHRIGGFENDQPTSRGMLTRSATPSPGADSAGRTPLLYDFGFEAGSDEARRLVNPEDPETADELWLSFEPATGELDLSAWDRIAEGRVDWDPRSDKGPLSESEIRRRLADLGRAVAEFARSQDAPPFAS